MADVMFYLLEEQVKKLLMRALAQGYKLFNVTGCACLENP